MTVFLCIMAFLALLASPTYSEQSKGVIVIASMAGWVILVLGLTLLAVFTWSAS